MLFPTTLTVTWVVSVSISTVKSEVILVRSTLSLARDPLASHPTAPPAWLATAHRSDDETNSTARKSDIRVVTAGRDGCGTARIPTVHPARY